MSRKVDIQLSKTLSWLLRHGAVKEKLPINADGFISLRIVLGHKSLAGKYTTDDVKRVVENNDKKRFILRKNSDGSLEIKACQGHSINTIDSLDLKPVTNCRDIPSVIHGTYYKFWNNIKTKGLSRMNRNHIHFAPGLPEDGKVVSGSRRNCELYIFIDLDKALGDGLSFFLSENNVILSPGNRNGYIEPRYFLKVIDSATGMSECSSCTTDR